MNKSLYVSVFLAGTVLQGLAHDEQHRSTLSMTIEDDLGRAVTFNKNPQRIISLAPSITEMLFALDSGATLVGVTDYCNFPPAAQQKPSVGGMILPNLERIAELQPDLILLTVEGNSKEDFTKLESLGYRLFVLNPRTIEEVDESITDLGKILGKDSAASSLFNGLRNRESRVHHAIQGRKFPSVFVIISLKPLMTAGPGTFIHQLIVKAGGLNIADHARVAYPIINREEIIRARPDVILVANDIMRSTRELLKEFPEWEKLPAVANGRILAVDADILTRPGPRIIDGLEMLARIFHPDLIPR